MQRDGSPRWTTIAILVGAIYLVVGLVSAVLAGDPEMRNFWRRAAWVVSVVVFLVHIVYELFARRRSTRASALHVAAGAALGSFGLAVAANLHSQPSTRQRILLAMSLVLWPAITAIPAFIVALVGAMGLERIRPYLTRSHAP